MQDYEAQHGIAVSTGMSATDLVSHLMVPGDRIIITDSVYGGTVNYFTGIAPKNKINSTFVDFTNLDNIKEALNKETKIVWLETVIFFCHLSCFRVSIHRRATSIYDDLTVV